MQMAWLVEHAARSKPANARVLGTGARARCSNDWLAPWLELHISRSM